MIAQRLMHYRAAPAALDRSRTYEQRPLSTFGKPVGFWVSAEGEDDWPSWCRREEFAVERLGVAYEVVLTGSANVLLIGSVGEIDSFDDEFAAPVEFRTRYTGIDRWAVTRRYDGVIIAPYQWERRNSSRCEWYYGWDCASGCIWNLDAIESVTAVMEVSA